jgi:hypothetical protein
MGVQVIGPATVILIGDCGAELEPSALKLVVVGISLESAPNARKKTPFGRAKGSYAPRVRCTGATTTHRWSGLSPSNVRTGSKTVTSSTHL